MRTSIITLSSDESADARDMTRWKLKMPCNYSSHQTFYVFQQSGDEEY